MTADGAPARARARDLGIVVGQLPAGRHNAITDVPGVLVGQTTIVAGSDIRTGVTAIVHERLRGTQALPAGIFVGNGFGKMVGVTQVGELGVIETPIVLTATLATFRAADALVTYIHGLPGNQELGTVNPVVAETNDGFLSDIRRRPVTEEHVLAALRAAAAGPVAEGAVGAGTGTSALGFKAGIGTASRIVDCGGLTVTIGALVQANFGGTLTMLGVPVPAREVLAAAGLADPPPGAPGGASGAGAPGAAGGALGAADLQAERQGNSCVIVLATDAPLDARQLSRIARRAIFSMARTGSSFEGKSGDYALAFSTAAESRPLADADLDPLFVAAMDGTEEAILNSLLMAETTTGFRQHVRHAVPLQALPRPKGARSP
jgi:D-aminopeptidase